MWQAAPFATELDLSGMIDLRNLWNLVRTKTCLPPTGITSGILAPWIFWELWTARNKLIFSNLRLEPEESLSRAIRMTREWQDGQEKVIHSCRPKVPIPIISTDNVLRTDAAWCERSKRAGLGRVLLQQHVQEERVSNFVTGAEHVPSPLMAEGMALREALQRSKDLGLMRLNVESDSKTLIDSILGKNIVPEIYGIVADILLLSPSFDYVSFKWISRKANYAADLVAKQVLAVNEALMTST